MIFLSSNFWPHLIIPITWNLEYPGCYPWWLFCWFVWPLCWVNQWFYNKSKNDGSHCFGLRRLPCFLLTVSSLRRLLEWTWSREKSEWIIIVRLLILSIRKLSQRKEKPILQDKPYKTTRYTLLRHYATTVLLQPAFYFLYYVTTSSRTVVSKIYLIKRASHVCDGYNLLRQRPFICNSLWKECLFSESLYPWQN